MWSYEYVLDLVVLRRQTLNTLELCILTEFIFHVKEKINMSL